MTTASEFLERNSRSSLQQWENDALALARAGSLVAWPMASVAVAANGHVGSFDASTDYLAIGIPPSAGQAGDYLRLPLTPLAAQRFADALGFVLPTPKMVRDVWAASPVKLDPVPLVPNRGASLAQYAEHSRRIDEQQSAVCGLRSLVSCGLTSGHKKDVVVGRLVKPGKVVIYGWFRPDGTNVQPRTNVHGDFYVDYSHGIRMISPTMTVDGQNMLVRDVLRDKNLSPLLSDEGALSASQTRYPTRPSLAVVGLQALLSTRRAA